MTTGMLASVNCVDEARLVLDAGADIIDLKNPDAGALGALDIAIIKQVVAQVDGRCTVSATIGDLPYQADKIKPAILDLLESGVDIAKIGVFGEPHNKDVLSLLKSLSSQGMRIVLVLFAELYNKNIDFMPLAQAGISGVMLDTMHKKTGSLRVKLSDEELSRFVELARQAGLMTGLAGSLTIDDIPVLLETGVDYLGFRGALCQFADRRNIIDPDSVNEIRALIPIEADKSVQAAITI